MRKSQVASSVFHLLGISMVVLIAAITTAQATGLTGSVDKIVDGDTLWICEEEICHKIRLCGINAPERNEPGYYDSAEALRQAVTGKAVYCVQVGNGTPCDGHSKPTSFDRTVAQCFADEADIAETLVKQGFACDWVEFSGGAYSSDGNGYRCKGTRK